MAEIFTPSLGDSQKNEIVLRTSAHMDKVLEEGYGEFVLSSRGYKDLEATGMMHLDVFWQLRQYFAEENYPLFQLTSKGHYLMHCCFLAKCLSPACSWAYTGEDFMGKCRDLAQSCSKGATLWPVSNKMMHKCLCAMHLTMSDPGLWFRHFME